MKLQTEVLIIGGGATGAGIARDLALRGIPSVLMEKGDYAAGASGRNQGLLHSGARYVVNDPEAARECISENLILRRIAPHCVEETGGLFVSLPEDDRKFENKFLTACEAAGMEALPLDRREALRLEPNLNPNLRTAIRVPDGAVDPFTLVLENVRDAQSRGAIVLSHTEVTDLVIQGGWVKGAYGRGRLDGKKYVIQASYVVNATGAWANKILNPIGINIPMALSKGTMIITNRRLSNHVINRLRPPSDGDIIVPNDSVSLLGTTSVREENPDAYEASAEEVSFLVEELAKLLPILTQTRFTRAYAGIRPLLQTAATKGDRAISRGFALLDHSHRDGINNLITITGGKLITYRLMAEKVVDCLGEKMGFSTGSSTAITPLPGAGSRHGLKERLGHIGADSRGKAEIICECELIDRAEIEAALKNEYLLDLQDLLHRTRLAKGTCQGGFCVYRLMGILHRLNLPPHDSNKILMAFLEERWKGSWPVLWGASLREGELIEAIYKEMFNLGRGTIVVFREAGE
jgi:glycerol-3-phosphate dehydrogenase